MSITDGLPRGLLDVVIDELALAVVVMDGGRVIYENRAASSLVARLQRDHSTDLALLLRDQIDEMQHHLRAQGHAVSLVTAGNGESFYFHVRGVIRDRARPLTIACIRELAPEREAVKQSYGLSRRECQVLELALRGCGNRDIAELLGISVATAKKHLTRIFDKVGVDSRSQLISRLA
jgi:DNA-binding CsgD family transcriptional regulator